MNSRPMILRFSSGSRTPSSASRKIFDASTTLRTPGRRHEVALDLLGLALAQQSVVDEHTGQLVTDRPLHERRRDRRVDAAGQTTDGLLVADLLADPARPARRRR